MPSGRTTRASGAVRAVGAVAGLGVRLGGSVDEAGRSKQAHAAKPWSHVGSVTENQSSTVYLTDTTLPLRARWARRRRACRIDGESMPPTVCSRDPRSPSSTPRRPPSPVARSTQHASRTTCRFAYTSPAIIVLLYYCMYRCIDVSMYLCICVPRRHAAREPPLPSAGEQKAMRSTVVEHQLPKGPRGLHGR
ncbi:hypothetical protein P280DRAFT_204869 [Massarina eburnea CBS 473.64]|uniref:Uncharacterized protein n=1 Tax=Massarina eburnea CBS 473.64 TaxID=1395130 RepID=A0A6A6RLX7_9PLEO|nr:hypothetical protein P280DRAFT_204869 [Massarina eburnea CBS 473.64]